MIEFGIAGCLSRDMNDILYSLHEKEIRYYEIGFQYRIPENLPEDTLNVSAGLGVKLSCHLPFFINFGNKEKVERSMEYLIKGLKVANTLQSIAIFHLGYYGKNSFESIKSNVIPAIESILDQYSFNNAKLGIETTGRKKEIGTLDDVLTICQDLSRKEVVPVIDWSHIYARSNGVFPRTIGDFRATVLRIRKMLGLRNFYFHGGGVKYNRGNERKHIAAKSCEPPLPYLLLVLKELNCKSVLIVESPTSIEDASWLKEVYKSPESWLEFTKKQLEKSKGANLDKYF